MRTYSNALERLNAAGLRPTRQRLALAKLLLEKRTTPLTAEELYHEAADAGIAVSLATVYNTLHQFTSVGLLREVVVDMGQSYFDTNTSHHHHFFDEGTGELTDIAEDEVEIGRLPSAADRVGDRARRGDRPAARRPLTPRPGHASSRFRRLASRPCLTHDLVRAACPRTRCAAASRAGLRSRPGTSCPRNRTAGRSRRARPAARSARPDPACAAAPGPRR